MLSRRRAWELLHGEHAEDRASRWVNYLIVVLILASVVAYVLETMPEVSRRIGPELVRLELFAVAVFSVEYVGRLWTVPEDPRYSDGWRGRLRWIGTPLAIVDLLAILPFYLGALVTTDLILLRVMRLFRILRIAKISRYSESLRTMTRVFRNKRRELLTSVLTLSLLLVLAAWGMWLVEGEVQPEAFASVPATLWWAVITITTVGYGDVVPVTALGRLLAGVIAVIGLGFIALPSGIFASGFVEEMTEQQRAEEEAGRELPARCPHCHELLRE